jgi:ABC-2 type transport system ATP-binding protein
MNATAPREAPVADPTPTAVLDVDGLAKTFGDRVAVRDLSFQAQAGEIIVLLCPNGAGKTTAIRMLSTSIEPTRGHFAICDIPDTKPIEIRRRIGVLPESSGYPLRWTGREYLQYYGRLFGYSASQSVEISASLLSDVGLADRARSPIRDYSRGMRQRLGVARALINNPRIIFLDEPTLGLDPAGQRQMLALIRDLALNRGAAVILSTHFLDEVEEVCSRVLILHRGVVIAQGTIAEITRQQAPTSARILVPPERHSDAVAAVSRAEGVSRVSEGAGDGSSLVATFERNGIGGNSGVEMTSAIGALVDARIPILSFERQGGRLSDAFLALTEEQE